MNKVQTLNALLAGVGLFNSILDPADLHQLTDVGGTIDNEMVNNSKLKTLKDTNVVRHALPLRSSQHSDPPHGARNHHSQ